MPKEDLKRELSLQTPYQKMELYRDPENKLMLTLDTYFQFKEGIDEEIYHHTLVNKALENYKIKDKNRCLILGGGDGLVARNLIKLLPLLTISLVDIDEAVVGHFLYVPELKKINENSLELCNKYYMDAYEWVKIDGTKYDIIILDLPDPNYPKLEKLYSKEFYKNCCKLLERNGIISIQSRHDLKYQIARYIHESICNHKIIEYETPYMGQGAVIVGKNAK